MLRGFFRPAAGPGWALVGDAGHFKHPATAQGISDAIEQALHVAGAVERLRPRARWLSRRGATRAPRATTTGRFSSAAFPRPEVAGPLFEGIGSDPAAEQDFRDTMSRAVNPRDAMSKERLERRFSTAGASG